jgi:cob(I)alamin adenosyltransferase
MTEKNLNNCNEIELWSGEKVKKNHPVMVCLCELEIFDSALSLSYEFISDHKDIFKSIKKIQLRLVELKGEINTHPRCWADFYKKCKPIKNKDLEYLDNCYEKLNKKFKDISQIEFHSTYGEEGKASAYFDHLNNLCKKCEIVLYNLDDVISDAEISVYIKQYLNKLSQYLFLIARYVKEI